MHSPLRKLLWMIVAIAAMTLLAPLAASAHEGHGSRPPVSHMAAHHQHASGQVDRAVARQSVPDAVAQQGVPDASDRDGLCTGGCCYGMGCCGAAVASEVSGIDPPCGRPLIVTMAPRPLASTRLTSLLEPPNALA